MVATKSAGVGGSRNGGYVQGGSNGRAGYYNYDAMGNGYGGDVQRGKGGVTAKGQYNQPVPGMPYVQQRNQGQVDFRGRDSRVSGSSDYYVGGQKLGGQNQSLDSKGFSNNMNAGPMRYREEGKAEFRGRDTKLTYGREYGVNGLGGAGANASASRKGISAQGNVNVLGQKQHFSARVDGNTLKVPNKAHLRTGSGNPAKSATSTVKKLDPGRAVKGTGAPSSKQVFGEKGIGGSGIY